ncbi:MAG TPA: hypothetical protein VFC78_02130 [Tepidisphaeraceae bacterium]|nr:hypothetical protein [Tepidisphaeraceae bacterium]
MSGWPSTVLALLIGIAGWYYLFYSRAAHKLAGIEAQPANLRRVRLRRANGGAMVALAILLYIGTRAIDSDRHPRQFLVIWLAVFAILVVIVLLAMADVRLTLTLRASQRKDDPR